MKTNQKIKSIALADMEPESGYQRSTNPAQVENIVNNFDETKLGTLIVSERNGKFHIIDGAHRSKALRKLGYTHALCVTLIGLTFSQEAEYFRKQNEDKRNIKPMEFFKAGLVSGDEECLTINEIVNENGFQIGIGSNDFYKIAAVKALFTITKKYGFDVLDDTLYLIARAWVGTAKATCSASLLGVAEFVSRYGMADFADRLKDKFSIIFYDYEEALHLKRLSQKLPAHKKFCRTLMVHYNKGLAKNSKRRLK